MKLSCDTTQVNGADIRQVQYINRLFTYLNRHWVKRGGGAKVGREYMYTPCVTPFLHAITLILIHALPLTTRTRTMEEAITITQASLTGEMMPIERTVRLAAPRPRETLDLLHNEGTSVVTGNGHALVVSTGKDTYMASIASELSKWRPENATQIGIRKVSYVLMCFVAVSRHFIEFCEFCESYFSDQVMAPIVFIVQGAVSKNWKGTVMFAIAVAVGITPEMLPMIVVCVYRFLILWLSTTLVMQTSNLALSVVREAFRCHPEPWHGSDSLLRQDRDAYR
jgi:hypothetical protein